MPRSSATLPATPPTLASPPAAAPGAPRLPGLDGLRAFSVAMVVLWHVSLTEKLHSPLLENLWRVDVGNLGVRVFFVLSGFLITTLLLEEHRATGEISLRRFYLRRALRIMPAYYAFLAVIAITASVGVVRLSHGGLLRAGAYVSNYSNVGWALGHTWSLSVEEQFYLLWPGALVLLGVRRAFVGAAVVLVASPAFRVLATHSPPLWPMYWRFAFECVADALATGCLLAYLRPRLWRSGLYRGFLSSPLAVLPPIALLVVSTLNVRHTRFAAVIGVSLVNVCVALVVDWTLRFPSGAVGRLLNWRPIAFVGTLSYSLYLWQQPFLSKGSTWPVPLSVAAIACAALLSHFAVERPALRLRARLERRTRPASAGVGPDVAPRVTTPA
jgi:peptidoglycan/LPS O-acetylase OafA/YrhL